MQRLSIAAVVNSKDDETCLVTVFCTTIEYTLASRTPGGCRGSTDKADKLGCLGVVQILSHQC